jgi:hypothetical protein
MRTARIVARRRKRRLVHRLMSCRAGTSRPHTRGSVDDVLVELDEVVVVVVVLVEVVLVEVVLVDDVLLVVIDVELLELVVTMLLVVVTGIGAQSGAPAAGMPYFVSSRTNGAKQSTGMWNASIVGVTTSGATSGSNTPSRMLMRIRFGGFGCRQVTTLRAWTTGFSIEHGHVPSTQGPSGHVPSGEHSESATSSQASRVGLPLMASKFSP